MTVYVKPAAKKGHLLVRDVTVVDTADGSRTAHQDIVMNDGLIASIAATGAPAGDAAVVEGNGFFVIPGLVDSHAHPLNNPQVVEGAYALMLAAGVTGFRQMAGSDRLIADRAAGRLPVWSGAPALLATPGDLLTPLNASTEEQVRATVRHQKEVGADFVKSGLTTARIQLAALDEGRRVGIRIAGHLPADLDPRLAAEAGMLSIEHLGPGPTVFAATATDEAEVRAMVAASPAPALPKLTIPGMSFLIGRLLASLVVNPATMTSPEGAHALELADTHFDEARARALARVFVQHDTWQCPTLIRVHTQQLPNEHLDDKRVRWMDPREVKRWRKSTKKYLGLPGHSREVLASHWDTQLRLLRVFDEENVPLLAGTDACGAGWVIPGFALHDEFDLLARAGLSPLAILKSATSSPARFFGVADVAGSVSPGCHADLVLLGSDPIADHRALHDITGVVREGAHWSRADLDGVLKRMEADPRAR